MPPSDDFLGVARLRNFVRQPRCWVSVQRQMLPPSVHQDDALCFELWVPEDPKDRHRAWIIGLVSREGAVERRYAVTRRRIAIAICRLVPELPPFAAEELAALRLRGLLQAAGSHVGAERGLKRGDFR
jgi:hypothetical protein